MNLLVVLVLAAQVSLHPPAPNSCELLELRLKHLSSDLDSATKFQKEQQVQYVEMKQLVLRKRMTYEKLKYYMNTAQESDYFMSRAKVVFTDCTAIIKTLSNSNQRQAYVQRLNSEASRLLELIIQRPDDEDCLQDATEQLIQRECRPDLIADGIFCLQIKNKDGADFHQSPPI